MLLAALAAACRLSAQTPPPAPTLHFDAHWRLLPVGQATMRWEDSPAGKRIVFTADSSSMVNLFYPVHDIMQSDFDPATHCTSDMDNHVVEGRRRRHTQVQYLPAEGKLVLDETDLSRTPPVAKHEEKPIPGCVFDLLSTLDYIRSQPLHVGDVYHFLVNEGGATSAVTLTVDLRETIATPAGRFSAVRAVPALADPKALPHPGQMWIWFSDDSRHLPVQIETKVSWGTLIAQLTP